MALNVPGSEFLKMLRASSPFTAWMTFICFFSSWRQHISLFKKLSSTSRTFFPASIEKSSTKVFVSKDLFTICATGIAREIVNIIPLFEFEAMVIFPPRSVTKIFTIESPRPTEELL